MGEAAHSNAMRMKASVGHRAREAEGLSPTRALRLAAARSAGDLWELPLSIAQVRHEIVGFEDLQMRLPRDQLTLILDGPESFAGGAFFDRQVLTGLIEVQTLGEVTEREPADRPFTATDAAMIAPLLDDIFQRLDVMLKSSVEGDPKSDWIIGYRYGAIIEDTRKLTLALEGIDFHILTLDVDIAMGMRKGAIVLCLPETFDLPKVEEPVVEVVPSGPGPYADVLSQVPIQLAATLPKIKLSLSQVTSLAEGDRLNLPAKALERVRLRDVDGNTLGTCELGKSDGMWALRLKDEDASRPMVAAADMPSAAASVPPAFADQGLSYGVPDVPEMQPDDLPDLPDISSDLDAMPDLPDLPPMDAGDGLPALPDLPPLEDL